MEAKYGKESEQVINYKNEIEDEALFKKYILSAASRLDSLYKQINDLPLEEKKAAKSNLIENIKQKYKHLNFLSDLYEGYFDNRDPNNTFFMSYLRYNSQADALKNQLMDRFDGDLRRFLADLKKTYPSL